MLDAMMWSVVIQCVGDVYHTMYTSPACWIKTHHIIASSITPHRVNNFNFQDFKHYPFLTCIYITYIILTKMNVLSDHDAQIINLNTLYYNKSHEYQTYFKRSINKYTMAELQNSLRYESWDQVFDSNDVNQIFNSFMRIFYATFPLKKINNETKAPWTTKGIKTSSI